MFSIRLVNADYYVNAPIPGLDVNFSKFRNSDVKQVPVVRIFGATTTGLKTCLHIHGVFPYVYIPYDGSDDKEKLSYQLATGIDQALNVTLGNADSKTQHVYNVVLVSGIPMYGYHEKEEQYFKIYFYNPSLVKKATNLLQNGAILNKVYQPHESHIPFMLQFLIDYNLYGMHIVNLAGVRFRKDPDNPGALEGLPGELLLPDAVVRISTCKLEADAVAADILNRKSVTDEFAVNPGLKAIWEDEQQRRREELRPSPITPLSSQCRRCLQPTDSELFFKKRLQEQLLAFSVSSQMGPTSTSRITIGGRSAPNPTETREECKLLEASFLETHTTLLTESTPQYSTAERTDVDEPLIDEDLVLSLGAANQTATLNVSHNCTLMTSQDLEFITFLEDLVEEDSILGSQGPLDKGGYREDEDTDGHDLNQPLDVLEDEVILLRSQDEKGSSENEDAGGNYPSHPLNMLEEEVILLGSQDEGGNSDDQDAEELRQPLDVLEVEDSMSGSEEQGGSSENKDEQGMEGYDLRQPLDSVQRSQDVGGSSEEACTSTFSPSNTMAVGTTIDETEDSDTSDENIPQLDGTHDLPDKPPRGSFRKKVVVEEQETDPCTAIELVRENNANKTITVPLEEIHAVSPTTTPSIEIVYEKKGVLEEQETEPCVAIEIVRENNANKTITVPLEEIRAIPPTPSIEIVYEKIRVFPAVSQETSETSKVVSEMMEYNGSLELEDNAPCLDIGDTCVMSDRVELPPFSMCYDTPAEINVTPENESLPACIVNNRNRDPFYDYVLMGDPSFGAQPDLLEKDDLFLNETTPESWTEDAMSLSLTNDKFLDESTKPSEVCGIEPEFLTYYGEYVLSDLSNPTNTRKRKWNRRISDVSLRVNSRRSVNRLSQDTLQNLVNYLARLPSSSVISNEYQNINTLQGELDNILDDNCADDLQQMNTSLDESLTSNSGIETEHVQETIRTIGLEDSVMNNNEEMKYIQESAFSSSLTKISSRESIKTNSSGKSVAEKMNSRMFASKLKEGSSRKRNTSSRKKKSTMKTNIEEACTLGSTMESVQQQCPVSIVVPDGKPLCRNPELNSRCPAPQKNVNGSHITPTALQHLPTRRIPLISKTPDTKILLNTQCKNLGRKKKNVVTQEESVTVNMTSTELQPLLSRRALQISKAVRKEIMCLRKPKPKPNTAFTKCSYCDTFKTFKNSHFSTHCPNMPSKSHVLVGDVFGSPQKMHLQKTISKTPIRNVNSTLDSGNDCVVRQCVKQSSTNQSTLSTNVSMRGRKGKRDSDIHKKLLLGAEQTKRAVIKRNVKRVERSLSTHASDSTVTAVPSIYISKGNDGVIKSYFLKCCYVKLERLNPYIGQVEKCLRSKKYLPRGKYTQNRQSSTQEVEGVTKVHEQLSSFENLGEEGAMSSSCHSSVVIDLKGSCNKKARGMHVKTPKDYTSPQTRNASATTQGTERTVLLERFDNMAFNKYGIAESQQILKNKYLKNKKGNVHIYSGSQIIEQIKIPCLDGTVDTSLSDDSDKAPNSPLRKKTCKNSMHTSFMSVVQDSSIASTSKERVPGNDIRSYQLKNRSKKKQTHMFCTSEDMSQLQSSQKLELGMSDSKREMLDAFQTRSQHCNTSSGLSDQHGLQGWMAGCSTSSLPFDKSIHNSSEGMHRLVNKAQKKLSSPSISLAEDKFHLLRLQQICHRKKMLRRKNKSQKESSSSDDDRSTSDPTKRKLKTNVVKNKMLPHSSSNYVSVNQQDLRLTGSPMKRNLITVNPSHTSKRRFGYKPLDITLKKLPVSNWKKILSKNEMRDKVDISSKDSSSSLESDSHESTALVVKTSKSKANALSLKNLQTLVSCSDEPELFSIDRLRQSKLKVVLKPSTKIFNQSGSEESDEQQSNLFQPIVGEIEPAQTDNPPEGSSAHLLNYPRHNLQVPVCRTRMSLQNAVQTNQHCFSNKSAIENICSKELRVNLKRLTREEILKASRRILKQSGSEKSDEQQSSLFQANIGELEPAQTDNPPEGSSTHLLNYPQHNPQVLICHTRMSLQHAAQTNKRCLSNKSAVENICCKELRVNLKRLTREDILKATDLPIIVDSSHKSCLQQSQEEFQEFTNQLLPTCPGVAVPAPCRYHASRARPMGSHINPPITTRKIHQDQRSLSVAESVPVKFETLIEDSDNIINVHYSYSREDDVVILQDNETFETYTSELFGKEDQIKNIERRLTCKKFSQPDCSHTEGNVYYAVKNILSGSSQSLSQVSTNSSENVNLLIDSSKSTLEMSDSGESLKKVQVLCNISKDTSVKSTIGTQSSSSIVDMFSDPLKTSPEITRSRKSINMIQKNFYKDDEKMDVQSVVHEKNENVDMAVELLKLYPTSTYGDKSKKLLPSEIQVSFDNSDWSCATQVSHETTDVKSSKMVDICLVDGPSDISSAMTDCDGMRELDTDEGNLSVVSDGIQSLYSKTMCMTPMDLNLSASFSNFSHANSQKGLHDENIAGISQQNNDDKNKGIASTIDNSRCGICVMPKLKPPSRKEVMERVSALSIPEHQYQEPYFSSIADVVEKKEVGDKHLKVSSMSVRELEPFQSSIPGLVGLTEWRQLRIQDLWAETQDIPETNNNLQQLGNIKGAFASRCEVVMMPCKPPPSFTEVQKWSRAKEKLRIMHKETSEVIKQGYDNKGTIYKLMLPQSPGQMASDNDDCICLTPSSPVTPIGSECDRTKLMAAHSTPHHPTPSRWKHITSPPCTPIHKGIRSSQSSRRGVWRKKIVLSTEQAMQGVAGTRVLSTIQDRKCELIQNEGPGVLGTSVSMRSPNVSVPSPVRSEVSTEDSSLNRLLLQTQFRNQLATPKSRVRSSVSGCQIEGTTPTNSCGFKMSVENLHDVRALSEHQFLTLLVVELHIQTRGDLRPDPAYDPVQVLFYTVENDVPESWPVPKSLTGMIVVDNLSKLCTESLEKISVPCQITYVADEQALMHEAVALVRKLDPDILLGYEVEMLSWGYLFQRAFVLKMNLCSLLSRIPSCKKNSHIQNETDFSSKIVVTGRIVFSVWRLMRCEVALMSYTFENIVFHVLHQRLPLHSFRTLTLWWCHQLRLYKYMTIEYYLLRVKGIIRLLDHLDLIARTSELARLFGIQFYEVLSRGSQFRVESMMLRLAKPLNYVSLSPSVQQRASMQAPESLPLIMEPESRFYSDPVIVLDFQSLYPSLIIANNYCFSTCLGRVEHLGQSEPYKFGCTHLQVAPSKLSTLRDDINISPCGVAFVRDNIRIGILPRMLQEILNTRLMVKKSMKEHNDKTLHRVLHARQLGLKLIANVTYGYTAANFSGRMPCVEVADSVVSKGRETLQRAIQLVETTTRWGARVVYGDTDSLFVLVKGRSRKQAFKIGAEIVEAVTQDNPKPVKLKLEKVYQPCILQTKKRYVGYMYEHPDQEKPVYDAKGIETVRRDGCPAVAKMLEKCLHMLFDMPNVSMIKKYVQTQFSKLLLGRCNIQDLVFAREYRGMANYRPGACVPALVLTRKLLRTDRRAEPRVGERVPYVVVNGAPGLPLISLVCSPHDLLADTSLRVNFTYYITRVITPALNRCLSLIGVNVHSWFKDMPHKSSLYLPLLNSSETVRKTTISQYYTKMVCAACEQLTTGDLCTLCQQEPQKTMLALDERLQLWERAHTQTVKVCQSCCGRSSSIDCISLDCPVLFRKHQSGKDLKQAQCIENIKKRYFSF